LCFALPLHFFNTPLPQKNPSTWVKFDEEGPFRFWRAHFSEALPRRSAPSGLNRPNGNPVSTTTKPALEAAIDNLDSFRANLREALSGISAITSLLRQAIRDQRLNEREIQSVRQTLRSLQGVRI
jgi:hypothetical protein